jgi:hypothetical protein
MKWDKSWPNHPTGFRENDRLHGKNVHQLGLKMTGQANDTEMHRFSSFKELFRFLSIYRPEWK